MDETFWGQMSGVGTVLNSLPFAGLLVLIAVLPLWPRTAVWWDRNRNKFLVALGCATAGVLFYLVPTRDTGTVLHTGLEYLAFIGLLASLYIVSGGIHIRGAFAGFPWFNTLLLAVGALLANILGTTGASMLLIRPLIRANHDRQHKTHIVVFFIFLVSNIGGLLTPLGDPPLYVGFLRGVPFLWTLRLFPVWAFTTALLLLIFFLIDLFFFEREEIQTRGKLIQILSDAERPIHIQGQQNLFWLGGILATVLFSGYVLVPGLTSMFSVPIAEVTAKVFQILVFGGIAVVSFRQTPPSIHQQNHFSFRPILEVAVLFFGIFGAMIPALALLEAKAPQMDLSQPWQYFWLSGLLSSFLDNTPTYLSFTAMAIGRYNLSEQLGELARQFPAILAAISCGAVFMGANTYIGNGPNFMVKAIAEHAKVKMPSFGGYMLWSLMILVPVFVAVQLFFFL